MGEFIKALLAKELSPKTVLNVMVLKEMLKHRGLVGLSRRQSCVVRGAAAGRGAGDAGHYRALGRARGVSRCAFYLFVRPAHAALLTYWCVR